MDELFDAMEDPYFIWFIHDYTYATERVVEFGQGPFMKVLAQTMLDNSEES